MRIRNNAAFFMAIGELSVLGSRDRSIETDGQGATDGRSEQTSSGDPAGARLSCLPLGWTADHRNTGKAIAAPLGRAQPIPAGHEETRMCGSEFHFGSKESMPQRQTRLRDGQRPRRRIAARKTLGEVIRHLPF